MDRVATCRSGSMWYTSRYPFPSWVEAEEGEKKDGRDGVGEKTVGRDDPSPGSGSGVSRRGDSPPSADPTDEMS